MTQPQAVIRVGQARLTAGLDRYARLDLAAHREVFGLAPQLSAAELIAMCEQVDLRGRGGAAFPVARKLRSALARKRRPVIVVNGTEGEPGSAKDTTLLARSPYLVLDGAMLAARALGTREVIVAVAAGGPHGQSVADAVAADRAFRSVRVVSVPERFVSGESSALVNAINGRAALPSGGAARASDAGVRGLPTLLSNAETFAQLAVLAMLGPDGYASVGAPAEPGTVLLTVGGSVAHPAVVETPTDVPLGHILDICGAGPASGVLVGGYHGRWLPAAAAYDLPVSRAALAAGGGTLGAGIVLVLGADTCPLAEVSRVAGYLAMQSSGQCGPCKQGLPAVASSLAALAAGSGGMDDLESVRRAAAGVRGRGACHHPDGTANFVSSALDVFTADITEHLFRGNCGRPAAGLLPLAAASESRLTVDWTRCQGHGLCARLVPELIEVDQHGYPAFLDAPVPFWLSKDARQAVDMCPALALSLTAPESAASRPRLRSAPKAAALSGGRPARRAIGRGAPDRSAGSGAAGSRTAKDKTARSRTVPDRITPGGSAPGRQPAPGALDDEPPTLTGRALRRADLAAASAWLEELGGRPLPRDD